MLCCCWVSTYGVGTFVYDLHEIRIKMHNKEPLGYTQRKILNNGDLVTWKTWKVEDKKLQTITNYGTILNIEIETRGHREIYVASVLCSNTGKTISVNLLRLDKDKTT